MPPKATQLSDNSLRSLVSKLFLLGTVCFSSPQSNSRSTGGARGCIGYRFSILELKAILSVLVDAFTFTGTGVEIEPHAQLVTRPYVTGQLEEGSKMPIRVALAT